MHEKKKIIVFMALNFKLFLFDKIELITESKFRKIEGR